MPTERDTSKAVMRTYMTTSVSKTGTVVYHARITSTPGHVDRRGSGPTPEAALTDARRKITKKKKRTHQ
jgi:hypothetical protein